MLIRFSIPIVGLLMAASGSCAPQRPSGVPLEARAIKMGPGRDNAVWQRCEARGMEEVRCSIWNSAGAILESGRFIPLDGGKPPGPADLAAIRSEPPLDPIAQVTLTNGRILVPESRFEELKRFNETFGKSSGS